MMIRQPKEQRKFVFRITRLAQTLVICSIIIVLCTGCQVRTTAVRQPTADQLLARIASADNYGLEFFKGEATQLQSDIGILTTAKGPYLTPFRKSQLVGSVAGRLETMTTMGTTVLPMNEQDSTFESVDSKEILAARLMTDVCLACSSSSNGPVIRTGAIAERVAMHGTLAAKDAAYLQSLSRNLKRASELIGQYAKETDPSLRKNITEQVTEVCTQLKGQQGS